MAKEEISALQILNTSGFPFQLRVAEEIIRTPGRLGWEVLAQEHYWRSREAGEFGFIDIVAGYGIVRLVVECKRGAGATWLFIAKNSDPMPVNVIRSLCTERVGGEPHVWLWSDLAVAPESPQASFCVVRGQADKEPMLERLAAPLLQSVESLAEEELSLGSPSSFGEGRIYIPVVVTAASLVVCRFDPERVDPAQGTLPNSAAAFESAPFVRFRKAFGGAPRDSQATSLQEAQRENQRTVLVVQAASLGRLLDEWEITSPWGGWPHHSEREKLRRLGRKT
jgi:hypothetical protein